MKLVFCGTPDFAVPTLRAVHAAGHQVALVVTQPDRPAGRGMESVEPPVKLLAQSLGIAVTQPEKIRNNEAFRAQLEAIAPDAILVVAYGRIIPPWMLSLPPLGNINLHASLLPKYRGAAPIQWAVASGETVTGNTTMRINEGLDTGDILLQEEIAIPPSATAQDMFPVLADAGAELMLRTLDGLATVTLPPTPQDHANATLAPILTKEDGRIDFQRTAQEIVNRFRGFQPWPGAYTTITLRDGEEKRLAITAMHVGPQLETTIPGTYDCGCVLLAKDALYIACGGNTILVGTELQLEGRKRMPAKEFLRGLAIPHGEQLG